MCTQSNTCSPPESTSQTASRSFSRFCRAHDCDRPTDRPINRQTDMQTNRPCYSVYNNRPHLRNTAVRPRSLYEFVYFVYMSTTLVFACSIVFFLFFLILCISCLERSPRPRNCINPSPKLHAFGGRTVPPVGAYIFSGSASDTACHQTVAVVC